MSAWKSWSIFCDGCRSADAATPDLSPTTAAAAREGARYLGWKHKGGKDYCPDCVAAGR